MQLIFDNEQQYPTTLDPAQPTISQTFTVYLSGGRIVSDTPRLIPAPWPLVRDTLLAALAMPGVIATEDEGNAVSIIRGTHQHAGEVRRDTYAHMTEDAATLAEQARAAFAKAHDQRCKECERLGPPRLGSCSECGTIGSEVEASAYPFGDAHYRAHRDPDRPIGVPVAEWEAHKLAGYEFGELRSNTSGVYRMYVRAPGTLSRFTFFSDTIDVNNQGWAQAHPTAFAHVRRLLLEAAEALPDGWGWHPGCSCVAEETCVGGPKAFAGALPVTGARSHAGTIPDAVWSAVEARARRLGLMV